MKANEKLTLVGIDVSAKELVVKIERSGNVYDKSLRFPNTSKGHKTLSKYITKSKTKARVCMEATGIYHFDLAVFLSKTKNIEVMVVNPRAIKNFSRALMKRAKNDPVDADVILNFLKRMGFEAWSAPSETCLKLRAFSRRMHQIKNEIVREKNRAHAAEYCGGIDKAIENDIEVNIRHLKKRIELLEGKALEVIACDPLLESRYALIMSIKGIGRTSAIQILSELVGLPSDMSAKEWVAYAGLDPRVVESGTSVNRPRKISKAGNKYLRSALYMPALVATQHEPNVKAFYDKLKDAKKKPIQALVAVMRKMLHAIWGIFHSNEPWDATKFYKPAKVIELGCETGGDADGRDMCKSRVIV